MDAVCVPAYLAQTVRKDLEHENVWDESRKLKKVDNMIAIPVFDGHPRLSYIVQKWPDAEIRKISLPPSAKISRKTQGQKLKDSLLALLKENGLPEGLLVEIPLKWERHGDLVVLPSTAFTSSQWHLLGETLWQTVAKALSCNRLAQQFPISDDGFRTPRVSLLLGHDGTVVHVDNGIKYCFDVSKCMFSSGNISEKLRVASWDCSDETVVDLYAGIGYFTLPYLVHAKARHVHACEWNPAAAAALRMSLTLNGVETRCTVHEGDNRQLTLSCVADRVNLGLIPSSEDGWPVAARVLKASGGVLHIHSNVVTTTHKTKLQQHFLDKFPLSCSELDTAKQNNTMSSPNTTKDVSKKDDLYPKAECTCDLQNDYESISDKNNDKTNRKAILECSLWAKDVCERIRNLLEAEKGGDWICQLLHIEKVKSYAPHIDHIVLDLKCLPKHND